MAALDRILQSRPSKRLSMRLYDPYAALYTSEGSHRAGMLVFARHRATCTRPPWCAQGFQAAKPLPLRLSHSAEHANCHHKFPERNDLCITATLVHAAGGQWSGSLAAKQLSRLCSHPAGMSQPHTAASPVQTCVLHAQHQAGKLQSDAVWCWACCTPTVYFLHGRGHHAMFIFFTMGKPKRTYRRIRRSIPSRKGRSMSMRSQTIRAAESSTPCQGPTDRILQWYAILPVSVSSLSQVYGCWEHSFGSISERQGIREQHPMSGSRRSHPPIVWLLSLLFQHLLALLLQVVCIAGFTSCLP